jgi:hypothetical protein
MRTAIDLTRDGELSRPGYWPGSASGNFWHPPEAARIVLEQPSSCLMCLRCRLAWPRRCYKGRLAAQSMGHVPLR